MANRGAAYAPAQSVKNAERLLAFVKSTGSGEDARFTRVVKHFAGKKSGGAYSLPQKLCAVIGMETLLLDWLRSEPDVEPYKFERTVYDTECFAVLRGIMKDPAVMMRQVKFEGLCLPETRSDRHSEFGFCPLCGVVTHRDPLNPSNHLQHCSNVNRTLQMSPDVVSSWIHITYVYLNGRRALMYHKDRKCKHYLMPGSMFIDVAAVLRRVIASDSDCLVTRKSLEGLYVLTQGFLAVCLPCTAENFCFGGTLCQTAWDMLKNEFPLNLVEERSRDMRVQLYSLMFEHGDAGDPLVDERASVCSEDSIDADVDDEDVGDEGVGDEDVEDEDVEEGDLDEDLLREAQEPPVEDVDVGQIFGAYPRNVTKDWKRRVSEPFLKLVKRWEDEGERQSDDENFVDLEEMAAEAEEEEE